MALLTDRTLAQSSAITPTTLIHIVTTGDTSQNPAGSSYKAELGQLIPVFSGLTFTGGSGNCIADFYVTNIHSCSPLFINPLDEGNVYFGSTSSVTVDLSNNRLGIGTTTPSKKLEVSGSDALIYGLTVGRGSGSVNSNTVLGNNALVSNMFGSDNISIGAYSTYSNLNGYGNISIGNYSLYSNTYGNTNIAIGLSSLSNNTVGASNVAIGSQSLVANISGNSNTSIGHISMSFNDFGYQNTAIGAASLYSNTTGNRNVAIGFESAYNNNEGQFNTVIGYKGLEYNTSGSSNTAIGYDSLSNVTTQSFNTGIGYNSNVGIGVSGSTAIGANSLVGTNDSIVLGNNIVNVGVGTSFPSEKLDVSGRTKTENFTMLSGASTGYVLTSIDNLGTSSWQPLSSLSGSSVISVTGVTTSAYTATTSYSYYGVTNLGGTSIEIPDPSGIDGYTIRIKDETGTASLNPITITPASGSIDGSGSVSMSINYMSLTMVARNNNWWII